MVGRSLGKLDLLNAQRALPAIFGNNLQILNPLSDKECEGNRILSLGQGYTVGAV